MFKEEKSGCLQASTEFSDPSEKDFEVVERKGLGHPDSLADGLAEAISNEYSRYCFKRWGVVPHHNVDKLYIGAGLWEIGYGIGKMKKPVQIRINGRISASFENIPIDLISVQRQAVISYLGRIIPTLKLDEHVVIDHNATQYTIKKDWFDPKSREDLPELKRLVASDTALCVAHAPLTPLEKICLNMEKYFWELSSEGRPLKPRFFDVGQDIKIMGIRNKRIIKLFICFPLLSCHIQSEKEKNQRYDEIVHYLSQNVKRIGELTGYEVQLYLTNGYLLAHGSCIECGEEGVVGRGNSLSGLISIMRPKGNEAYWGKNPVYHVGRVQMYLTQKFSRELYKATGIPNTVYTLGIHSTGLIPPHTTQIHSKKPIDPFILEKTLEEVFSKETYLQSIINQTITDNFHEKLY